MDVGNAIGAQSRKISPELSPAKQANSLDAHKEIRDLRSIPEG